MDVRISLRQSAEGAWHGIARTEPPVLATGPSREACLDEVVGQVRARLVPDSVGEEAVLIVEETPDVVGVAEVAEIMGWDKRRVVTYLDRGRFPVPFRSLRSGRIWLRPDVERFAAQWWSRQARPRPPGGSVRPPADGLRPRSER